MWQFGGEASRLNVWTGLRPSDVLPQTCDASGALVQRAQGGLRISGEAFGKRYRLV